MKQIVTRITKNEKVARNIYKMRLESKFLAMNINPGQFVQVRCSDGIDPLLRRPLGCHRILKDGIEMLYEVVGKGTEILSKRRKEEFLDIIGPLGNGFTHHSPLTTHHLSILVAGGIGVAPLVALAEAIVQRTEYSVQREKVHIFIGAKKSSHILCEQEFKNIGSKVFLATEDGSKGEKGLITALLKDFLRNTQYAGRSTIYACGPTEMLKTVAQIAKAKRIPCQVLLEEHIACGIGVCLGCPVKVRKVTPYAVRRTSLGFARDRQYEYKMVCKDGPVFDAEEILW